VSGERGSTFVEVVVAMFLLAILLAGAVPSFLTFTDLNTRNERRTGAVQAARVALEQHRLTQPSTMPSFGATGPQQVSVGNRNYDVWTRYCVVSTLCNGNSRHLVVEVDQDGEKLYTAETVFTELR
jgi:type II secretory pathway pseudopilin PulG